MKRGGERQNGRGGAENGERGERGRGGGKRAAQSPTPSAITHCPLPITHY
jgi:hypothetical protein